MYAIEVSATRFDILHGTDGYIVHTNHYLAESMKGIESDPEELIFGACAISGPTG